MSALTSLLVRDEVVSVRQIEDALQRQVLEGGEIDTALLELDAATENVLNAYRAASFGLPAASRAVVMTPAYEALSRVPEALAKKHRVVPVALRQGNFVMATAQPLSERALRELEGSLGASIEQMVATEVRIEAALQAHYGCEIAPRMRRLCGELEMREPGSVPVVEPMRVTDVSQLVDSDWLDSLDDGEDAEAMLQDDAVEVRAQALHDERNEPSSVSVAKVVSVAPPAMPEVGAAKSEAVASAGPEAAEPSAHAASVAAKSSDSGAFVLPSAARLRSLTPRARPRRVSAVPKGPLTKDAARALLEQTEERDEIVEVFFRFARQYFDSTVLFTVREDRALGLEAHNAPVADIREVSVLFERGGAFDDVMRSLAPKVVDLSRKEVDLGLALSLGRSQSQPCALVPVCIRQRVVSIVYGDRDSEHFRVDDIADLIELLPSVARAFERIIRTRKGFAMQVRRSLRPPVAAAPEAADPKVREPGVPLASWSTPPSAPTPRTSRPPADVAGVFPKTHEARLAGATLPGIVDVAARTSEEAASSAANTFSAIEGSYGNLQREARDKLTALGLPRSAPPPPMPSSPSFPAASLPPGPVSRELLEQTPTVRIAAQTPRPAGEADTMLAITPPRPAKAYSKPPPGAGAYSSTRGEEPADSGLASEPPSSPDDTRPVRRSRAGLRHVPTGDLPDTREPPAAAHSFRSRPPPARASKLPPGTGAYKAQDLGSETISLPPNKPPGASSIASSITSAVTRDSAPPQGYSSHDAPSDVVVFPPPPRVPGFTSIMGAEGARTARGSQPPSQAGVPSQVNEASRATDARREHDADGERDRVPEVVEVQPASRKSVLPIAPVSAEPSIIVDTAVQVEQLVFDLARMGPEDENRAVSALLRFGDEALAALAAHFPGPLWFDRRRPHTRVPAGRDVSAIARALSAFGSRATPQLAGLLRDERADVRFYATLLVSDRVEPELLFALAERLFDDDPQIRLIVKDALPHYRGVSSFDEVLTQLRVNAAHAGKPIIVRLAALDALAMLRDAPSVPTLIELNADSDKQISVPAHRALVNITGQDFGSNTKKWRAFWAECSHMHRAEWLIDSLMHDDQALRATAGLELQKLTQVYYGYVAAAPKRDRERAQRRYADWWKTEGRKKFQVT